jgi:predicted membrane-bound spermidine synthase
MKREKQYTNRSEKVRARRNQKKRVQSKSARDRKEYQSKSMPPVMVRNGGSLARKQKRKNKKNSRVLVGGLGMGFTLKAAIDNLPADAEVVVAELNPIMVKWCRGPIAHFTGRAVDDPRVKVVIDNVASVIRYAAMRGKGNRFDAIILDLYEGPYEGGRGRGKYLYGDVALALSRSALKAGGVLAVWSEDPDKAFEKRLKAAGFSVNRQRPGRGGHRHVVYIARKTSGSQA